MVILTIQRLYYQILEARDPRVRGWFLLDNPIVVITILGLYLCFCKIWGPALMKHRQPFELRKLLIFYNFALVILSAYTVSEFLQSGWGTHYSFKCQPVDYSNDPMALRMTRACHLYLMTKFIELLDTVFFVLRKKFNQITPLHVFHHSAMAFSCWFGMPYVPGGHGSFFGLINSFVHAIMYLYYGVSALGPKYQKYLWWKRYLTILQLVQFVLVLVHSLQLLFIECDYPKIIVYWTSTYAVIFVFLFSDFYKTAYTKQDVKTIENGEKLTRSSTSMDIMTERSKKKLEM